MERLNKYLEKLEKLLRFLVYKIGVLFVVISSGISLVLSIINNEENFFPRPIIFIGLCYLFILLFIGLIWMVLNTYKLNRYRKMRWVFFKYALIYLKMIID